MSLSRFFYSLLIVLLTPLFVVRLFIKGRQSPKYRQRISERFAILPVFEAPVKIWIHAVSVGETIASKPVVEALIQEYGAEHILMTTTTPTGADTVKRLFDGRIQHCYFPYDLPVVVHAYLKKVHPDILVVIETEIWPNLWHVAKTKNIPVMMVNARLSEKATQRYLKLNNLVTETVNKATCIACRNQDDVANFKRIGARAEILQSIGDVKLDLIFDKSLRNVRHGLREEWGSHRVVWVAASTHQGEDEKVLDLYVELVKDIDDLLLIIVPRHPERFDAVSNLVVGRGLRVQRRSEDVAFDQTAEVIIGDSMGEMMMWYAAADTVLMGGSLLPIGGHNPIEPIVAGAPVVSGGHVFNFTEAYAMFTSVKAAWVEVEDEGVLQRLKLLLSDESLRKQAVAQGQVCIEQHRGAVAKNIQLIKQIIEK
ncbi:MAG: Lipid IVA 3-deoxy-D-manno-octulosonic acid transferase (EC [often with (EC also] [uncultured Thiotrichaceae bacterium]|uniref:3-deoxy-D-manno-octulosonic acid transferase n=1 Tax=uncultured Thiotrichaceae bacterium TaxID=298394 RepID=A0A6S6U1R6_9GAMM|nr:MAG: Lipid IVA 3-deoxy-D-manno-octulosonic acid transferase (EC [often with (EC also] [uncultured Thiotrichaceae bacterium]